MRGWWMFLPLFMVSVMNLHGQAQEAPRETRPAIYTLPIEPMKQDQAATRTLAPYQGKVLLIVNVASGCGFTPQYKGLEQLYREYKDRGLRVLAFPCNDFGGQEPGSEAEILTFCRTRYDVTFPLFAKIHVNGTDEAPLYTYLKKEGPGGMGDVKWNFEKFLVSREGKVVGRYRSAVTPEDETLRKDIARELDRKETKKP